MKNHTLRTLLRVIMLVGLAMFAIVDGTQRYRETTRGLEGSTFVDDLGLQPITADKGDLTWQQSEAWQRFEVLHPLTALRVLVATQNARPSHPCALTLTTRDGTLRMAESVRTIPENQHFQWLEFRFDAPVDAEGDIVGFQLTACENGQPYLLPRSGENRFKTPVDKVAAAGPIVFKPVYVATRFMRWRDYLASEAQAIVAIAAFLCVLAWPRMRCYALVAPFAILLFFQTFVRVPFWVTDEVGHFAYAVHMMEHRSVPLTTSPMPLAAHADVRRQLGWVDTFPGGPMPFYEAVQGPLYYALVAVLGKLVLVLSGGNWALTLYALRGAGALCVVTAFCLLIRTMLLLRAKDVLRLSEPTLALVLVAVTFVPSVMTTLGALTNDQGTFLFGSLAFYLFVRLAAKGTLETRDATYLAMAAAALWLTKLTGAFVAVIFFLYLVATRRRELIRRYGIVVAAMVAPLHGYWLYHYHALSGIHWQINFVRPITNPSGKLPPLAVLLHDIARFFYTSLHAETVCLEHWQRTASTTIAVLPVIGFVIACIVSLRRLRTRGFYQTLSLRLDPPFLWTLVALGWGAPALIAVIGTIAHRVFLLAPRFAFPSLFCIAAGACLIVQVLPRRWGTAVAISAAVCALSVTASMTNHYQYYAGGGQCPAGQSQLAVRSNR